MPTVMEQSDPVCPSSICQGEEKNQDLKKREKNNLKKISASSNQ